MKNELIPEELNQLSERIIGYAIEVHRQRGPGLIEAQLLTCLKIPSKRLGLLLNFNSRLLKDGVKRMVL